MATSGSTDWTVTRDQIITEALENISAIDVGGAANATDVTSASTSLNLMIKALQSDRIFLRFVDEQTVPLVDGTTSYDLDAGSIKLLDAWLRISNTDYPLEIINQVTYDGLADKSGESQPWKVYVDYAPALPKAYFYPTPGASYTFHYRRERVVEDFDAAANNADFPVRANLMLVYGLTFMLAGKFGLPVGERQYWKALYEEEKSRYRAGDTERHSRMIVAPSGVV